MKHFIPHLKNKANQDILFRLFIFYGLLLLLLLVVGLSFYNNAIKNTEKQITQENIFTLENKITDFDSSFYIINSFASQISTNSNIHRLMLETELSTSFYIKASAAMEYLTELMCMQSVLPIDNCFIYLPETDYIILPTTTMPLFNYYAYRKDYDLNEYFNFKELISTPSNAYGFLPLESFLDDNSDKDSYLYFCNLYIESSASEPDAYFCLTIDDSKLLSDFTEATHTQDNCLYVIDKTHDFEYVFTNSESLDYTPQNLITTFAQNASSHSPFFSYNSTEYVVTYSVSSYNNFEYYLIQPASDILINFNAYKRIFQLILFIATSCSIIALLFFTRETIKPYIEIQNRLDYSESEKEILHTELINQRPFVCNAYLARIMNGNFDESISIDKIINFLNLDFSANYYAVLYIMVVNSYNKISENLNNPNSLNLEQEKLPINYFGIIKPLLQKEWGINICIYKPEPNHYALLLPIKSHGEIPKESLCTFIENTKNKCSRLQKTLEQEHFILIGCGLGKANARINFLWESYHLAKEAVSFVGKTRTFQHYKNIIRDNDVHYFPSQLAEKLTIFITTGNSRQTAEIFKLIISENFELRSLPYHIQEWLISDLRNTLVKIRYEMQTSNISPQSLDKLNEMILSIKTILDEEKIAIFMASLHETKVEKNRLIADVEQYLIENSMDTELSLNKISDIFDISESYFSSLFKAETKRNFSDYLEHLRMVHAMTLLKNTDIDVSKIYTHIGYNNSNSFRRAFKKNYGISPSSVRLSQK